MGHYAGKRQAGKGGFTVKPNSLCLPAVGRRTAYSWPIVAQAALGSVRGQEVWLDGRDCPRRAIPGRGASRSSLLSLRANGLFHRLPSLKLRLVRSVHEKARPLRGQAYPWRRGGDCTRKRHPGKGGASRSSLLSLRANGLFHRLPSLMLRLARCGHEKARPLRGQACPWRRGGDCTRKRHPGKGGFKVKPVIASR